MLKLIEQIAFILECGQQHSDCPDSWGTPETRSSEFYFAYSHVSYICACLISQKLDEPIDADTFVDTMMEYTEKSPKNYWVDSVSKILNYLEAEGYPEP